MKVRALCTSQNRQLPCCCDIIASYPSNSATANTPPSSAAYSAMTSPSSTRSRKPSTTSATSPSGLAFIPLVNISSRPCSSRTPLASWTTNSPPASVIQRRPLPTSSKPVRSRASTSRSSGRRWSRTTSPHQKPPRPWTRYVGTFPLRVTLHRAPCILRALCALLTLTPNPTSIGGCAAASVTRRDTSAGIAPSGIPLCGTTRYSRTD